jgi:YD repeat-containing protein
MQELLATSHAAFASSARNQQATGFILFSHEAFPQSANGNQTTRTVGGVAYGLAYDAENRLVSITQGGNVIATYTYNGDGQWVKSWVQSGNLTTAYVGNHFEWTGSTSTMKRYYYTGGVRVAVWVVTTQNNLYFLLGDHLGSTSITAASSGAETGELRGKKIAPFPIGLNQGQIWGMGSQIMLYVSSIQSVQRQPVRTGRLPGSRGSRAAWYLGLRWGTGPRLAIARRGLR